MPDKINLESSGLRRSDCSAVLSWRDKIYSHSTKCPKSVKRSSMQALVLFNSFLCAIGAEVTRRVQSHQVVANSSSSNKINLDSACLKSVTNLDSACLKSATNLDSACLKSVINLDSACLKSVKRSSLKLIVESLHSEITLHFCEDCKKFREGESEDNERPDND